MPMLTRTRSPVICVVLIVSLFSLPVLSSPLIAQQRRGIDVNIRGGLLQCFDKDDAACENIRLGGGFGGMVGFRFLSYLSVGVDFGLYLFNPETLEKLDLADFTFELRAYLPIRRMDVYGLFGGGFMQLATENSGFRLQETSWANMKWGGGFTVFFLESRQFGSMGLGFEIAYLWTNLKNAKTCVTGTQSCTSERYHDDKPGRGINAFEYSLNWVWIVPIFSFISGR